jgi:lysylphosphatidylglycerol synthetase-like protein (DUF2156 family)
VGLLGLLELALLDMSHLLSADIGVLMRTFHHDSLLLLFGQFSLGDELLVSESLVLDLHGIILIFLADELGRNNAIFSFRLDAACFEVDTFLPFPHKGFPFLSKKCFTRLSSLFSMKLLCLTSIIFWYLFLAISLICFFLLRSTYK